ncbi:hypothetical protein PSA83_06489 (plasmid) [Pseudomonas aeruginosa]|nr:hypothetical protein PSA83_06489 [Pseudomonas aeruginosa]
MQYMIDLTPHFDALARAITFEVQRFGQIELEALMMDLVSGCPEGMMVFDGAEVLIHPVLLVGALPAFSASLAGLLCIDDMPAGDLACWADAGYTETGANLMSLMSEGARKMIVWSTATLSNKGYCPLEVLTQCIASGESFDQERTRQLFRRSGLAAISAAS